MLKSIFGKTRAKASVAGDAALLKADPESFRTLVDFFPIGKKLRYYP